MKFSIVAVLLLFACHAAAGSSSVTSGSSTSINSSTSVTTDSSNNVSSSTSISTTTGSGGTNTTFCSTSDSYQQCEITCERPKVARCIEATAGKAPSCTCRQPRKSRKGK